MEEQEFRSPARLIRVSILFAGCTLPNPGTYEHSRILHSDFVTAR